MFTCYRTPDTVLGYHAAVVAVAPVDYDALGYAAGLAGDDSLPPIPSWHASGYLGGLCRGLNARQRHMPRRVMT